MGTSIDVFLPRDIQAPEEIALRLNAVFGKCLGDLAAVARDAPYGVHFHPWSLTTVSEHDGEPSYAFDEGPYGFDVDVYENVINFGSLERFGRLYSTTSPVAASLQRIVERVVRTLTESPVFAAVAGGMGDSDAATDLAYYQGAAFSAICDCLHREHGDPARSWDELATGDVPWCLIELPACAPTAPAHRGP